ncbi:MAG: energy transducer TonB [Gammaproteobacteria bacterium]|nr:energy transducer TonB [Gammaproteobacteria bacterium]
MKLPLVLLILLLLPAAQATSVIRIGPAYPQAAIEACIEGHVRLQFVADADGRPTQVSVVESLPPGVFDAAAERNLEKMRFEPGVGEETLQFRIADLESCPLEARCKRIGAAHANLLNSCFIIRRDLEIQLNGKLARREQAAVTYERGVATVEVLDSEIVEKRIQLDSGEGDMIGDIAFDCGRLHIADDGRYELHVADEPDVLRFEYDPANPTLTPVEWRAEIRERFLFKKFHIVASATYTDLQTQSCP